MTKEQSIELARKSLEIKTRAKVETAINILRMYGKKINSNSISKESGVSRITATKYLKKMGLVKEQLEK